jgi:EmrB/QacA subfamily drug resistance transporter
VILTVCLGAFVGQVDASIVQLALPSLESAFDARLDSVSWVAIAYSLAFASALPVFARLAEMGGRKKLYVSGFALFGLFSALCGLATGLGWLIGLRALQGASGALLGANSVVILVAAAGAGLRGRAMGVFSTAQAIGICVGPVIGGVILGSLTWPWIFWVTVPVAAVATVLGWRLIPADEAPVRRARFDVLGAVLLVPCLAAFLLAITELQSWPPPVVAALVVGVVVLGVAFVVRERRTPAPLLDLALFRSRAFSGGVVAVLASYAMLYGIFFLMSFVLVRGYGDSPLMAGVHLVVVPLALGIVAPFAGGWAESRPRAVMRIGMALCLVALVPLRLALTGDPGTMPVVLVALAAYGAGLGMFIAPNSTSTLQAAPPERAGQAGGLLNLLRAFGTATGIAAMSAVLTWTIVTTLGEPVGTHRIPSQLLLEAAHGGLLLLAVLAVLAGVAATLRDRAPAAASPHAGG